MPFLLDILNKEPGHNFTAVIFVQIGVTLTPSSALYRLVKTITRSQYVARVSFIPQFSFSPVAIAFIAIYSRNRNGFVCVCIVLSVSFSDCFLCSFLDLDYNFMGIGSANTFTKAMAKHWCHSIPHHLINCER